MPGNDLTSISDEDTCSMKDYELETKLNRECRTPLRDISQQVRKVLLVMIQVRIVLLQYWMK